MLAVVPSAEMAAVIDGIRFDFAKTFGFRAALKPPVHITICAPFLVDAIIADTFEQKMSQLKNWAGTQTPFEIFLDGYNFFNNPEHPVLIIHVKDNIHLQNMQGSLAAYMKTIGVRKCKSSMNHHITIGYRDIPSHAMPAIREYYSTRNFHGAFVCDRILLWKHDGIRWRTAMDYSFKSE